MPAGKSHIAVLPPRDLAADAELLLERYAAASQKISAAIRFLAVRTAIASFNSQLHRPADLVLLTNGTRRHGAHSAWIWAA